MTKPVVLLVTLAMLAPTVAPAFNARNNLKVAETKPSVFEVVGRPGTSPRNYWCAAGDFVVRTAPAPKARVYLVRGPGPSISQPGRKAVQFTTDPRAAGIASTEPSMSVSVTAVGDNMSAAEAQQFCYNNIETGR